MMPQNVLIVVIFLVLIRRCSSNGPSFNGVSSEIYLFEHQVTKTDAKDAFKIYNESSFDGVFSPLCPKLTPFIDLWFSYR